MPTHQIPVGGIDKTISIETAANAVADTKNANKYVCAADLTPPLTKTVMEVGGRRRRASRRRGGSKKSKTNRKRRASRRK